MRTRLLFVSTSDEIDIKSDLVIVDVFLQDLHQFALDNLCAKIKTKSHSSVA